MIFVLENVTKSQSNNPYERDLIFLSSLGTVKVFDLSKIFG